MASFLNNAGRLIIVATLAIAPMAFAADKGYFGFAISVDAEGFSFNPMLKTVSIDKVTPGSPAEAAGLTKGDQFIEVEGRAVAGAKADDIKPFLSKNIGETVTVKIKKVSGQIVVVTLIAAKKP